MKIIQSISRHQIQFSSLEEQVAADNAIRILDAFVEKLDLYKLGIAQLNTNKQQTKTNPGGAPRFEDKLLLKLYLENLDMLIMVQHKKHRKKTQNWRLFFVYCCAAIFCPTQPPRLPSTQNGPWRP